MALGDAGGGLIMSIGALNVSIYHGSDPYGQARPGKPRGPALYYPAASLRGSPIAADHLPDLREDHHALASSGDPAVARYILVNIETDRIANSLNTLAMEAFTWERG